MKKDVPARINNTKLMKIMDLQFKNSTLHLLTLLNIVSKWKPVFSNIKLNCGFRSFSAYTFFHFPIFPLVLQYCLSNEANCSKKKH